MRRIVMSGLRQSGLIGVIISLGNRPSTGFCATLRKTLDPTTTKFPHHIKNGASRHRSVVALNFTPPIKMSALSASREDAISKEDRVTGVLIGLACGDAVGCTSEGNTRSTFPEVTDMVGGGVHDLTPGQWTDDTSLALCLAQSLIEKSGHDPRDQLLRYIGWLDEGRLSSNGKCFDVGNTTRRSLEKFRASDCTENYCGSTHPSQGGNGSLMRLAPVPMLLHLQPELAIQVSGETSRTTHASKACVDSCRYFAGLIVGAIEGASKESLLATGGFVPKGMPGDFWSNMSPPLEEGVAEVALEASHAHREPPDESLKISAGNAEMANEGYLPRHEGDALTEIAIANNGYVVRSLEAALWAFGRSHTFEEGCLMVANLGDDADTVAAIYGQLAGAYYGASGIPFKWRNALALGGLLESIAEELYDMSLRVDPNLPPLALSGVPTTEGTASPPRDLVTRFSVNPEKGEGGAYWEGGVAAHHKRLENEYISIVTKEEGGKNSEAYKAGIEAMRKVLEQQQQQCRSGGEEEKTSRDAGGDAWGVKRAGPAYAIERKIALTVEFMKRLS